MLEEKVVLVNTGFFVLFCCVVNFVVKGELFSGVWGKEGLSLDKIR